jgi:hypothetical protein
MGEESLPESPPFRPLDDQVLEYTTIPPTWAEIFFSVAVTSPGRPDEPHHVGLNVLIQ